MLEKLSLVLIKNRTLEEASLTSELLTDSLRETPEIAVLEIERHVLLFTDTVAKLPSVYQKILLEQDPKLISELLQYFSNFTLKSEKFKNELSRIVEVITEQELSLETSKKIRNLVTTSTQLEEIAKIFEQLVITFIRKKEEQIWFSPDQRIEVQRILGMLNESFVVLFKNLNTDNQKLDMREALAKKNEVEAQREYMRLAHFKEAEDGMLSVKNTLIYTEIYTACTRISEEIFTITEYLVGCDVTSRGIRFK